MTGLTNSASAGHSALEPQLCDPAVVVEPEVVPAPDGPAPESQSDPDAWRREVAARLARYRTRRKPRAPRYPSLFLPFDSYDSRSRPHAAASSTPLASPEPARDNFPLEDVTAGAPAPFDNRDERQNEDRDEPPIEDQIQRDPDPALEARADVTAKIIEFPRSAAIPVVYSTPLADPIFDRPRIVEAPEILPPAPALGGILMEPVQPEPADRPVRAESPIPKASIPRRLLAAGTDVLILGGALSAFAAVFLHFNPVVQFSAVHESLPPLAGFAGALAVVLWMAYQFLFVGCIGTTAGLLVAGLKLAKFDGSAVACRARCWRVFASFLSVFAAGLGYLWCFLDQDSLCWHDRITRTCLQSVR